MSNTALPHIYIDGSRHEHPALQIAYHQALEKIFEPGKFFTPEELQHKEVTDLKEMLSIKKPMKNGDPLLPNVIAQDLMDSVQTHLNRQLYNKVYDVEAKTGESGFRYKGLENVAREIVGAKYRIAQTTENLTAEEDIQVQLGGLISRVSRNVVQEGPIKG